MVGSVRILGIHSSGHDTGVALFENGDLLYAIETERLSRIKHDHRVELALDNVLAATDLDLADIDLVAASTNIRNAILNIPDIESVRQLVDRGTLSVQTTCSLRGHAKECLVVAHEASHAILACHYANYRHPLLVLVNEGRGSFSRNSLFLFDGASLILLDRDSLPWFGSGFGWSAIGHLLGYGAGPDVAGTIMGLSGHGHSTPDLEELFISIEPDIHLKERALQEKAASVLQRHAAFQLGNQKGHEDIVATLQTLFTKATTQYLGDMQRRYGVSCLALGGGCALNIIANSAAREALCSDLAISPACNDSGQALGAAIFAQVVMHRRLPKPFEVYRNGRSEPQERIDGVIAGHGFSRQAFEPASVAEHLAEGKVIGLMIGTAELGPRALGHRSILAHPARAGMRRQVSEILKKRHWFRPLAPCMRREQFDKLFPGQPDSPHMLFSYDGRTLGMPEACHIDGTARIQTVDGLANPQLAAIIEAFEYQTGLPGLINTSLNVSGKSIAHSARDLFDDFLGTSLDYAVINDVVIEMS